MNLRTTYIITSHVSFQVFVGLLPQVATLARCCLMILMMMMMMMMINLHHVVQSSSSGAPLHAVP
jgi:hypothetical protein